MLLHPLGEQLGVAGGVEDQERRAEAGGEGGLGLVDPDLGPRGLGGVAAQEVVHRLGRGEPAHRRQDPKASQVRKMMSLGCEPMQGIWALSISSIG